MNNLKEKHWMAHRSSHSHACSDQVAILEKTNYWWVFGRCEKTGEPRGNSHVPVLLELGFVLFRDGVTVTVGFSVSGSDTVEDLVKSSPSLVVVCVREATVVGATVVVVVVVDVVLVVFVEAEVVPSMASKTSSEPPLSWILWTVWVLAVFSVRDKGRKVL